MKSGVGGATQSDEDFGGFAAFAGFHVQSSRFKVRRSFEDEDDDEDEGIFENRKSKIGNRKWERVIHTIHKDRECPVFWVVQV